MLDSPLLRKPATGYCLAIENILTNHQSERTVQQEGGHQAVEKIKKQDENSFCHGILFGKIIFTLLALLDKLLFSELDLSQHFLCGSEQCPSPSTSIHSSSA